MKTVEYKNFNTSVEALGQIISTQPIDIVAEVSGKIVKGDVVLRKARNFNKGALLFRVDNGEVILNLKSQRSNFLNALVLMLSDLKLDFPDEFDKWNNYFLGIDISRSIPNLPTINSDREKTFVATKNILGQFYSIKSAEERLSKYEVYAPYSGTITDVYTDAGSVANPGTRIVKVMRTDQLELELPVRKEDIQWIKIGTNVQLFSEDKRQSANGKVVRMSNTLDPNTQSINVYISVNPRGMKLYEGMYLVAKLAGRSINNAMEIDRKAVFDNNKVYVMTADSLLEQRIITVHKVNTETILCSGLDKGAKVVNDNLLGLSESVKVVPLK
jgi:membrane fusion protein (multidrug efflux system)